MAEEEEKKEGEEGEGEEGGKKKSPMMLIIIGVVALLLIIAIVVVVLVLGGEEEPPEGAVSETKKVSKQIKEATEAQLGPVVPMEQFIVNLVSNNGRRYLKTEMQFELSGEELMEEAQNKQPLIRDVIIRTLSSKTYEEISTENGKIRLKEELIGNINAKLVDGEVVNVFFTKFVVQ